MHNWNCEKFIIGHRVYNLYKSEVIVRPFLTNTKVNKLLVTLVRNSELYVRSQLETSCMELATP